MSEERPWWRGVDWPNALAYLGAAVAFVIGLQQYREDQRWRRLEFVTQRLADFESRPEIRMARLILEYPRPTICLFGGEPGAPGAACTTVTDSLLVSALATSTTAPERLSVEETRIVEILDQFLNTLEQVDFLLEGGFLGDEREHPTVAYWISLVGDRDWIARPPPVQEALCDYLARYEYTGTRDLVLSYVPPERLTCSGPFFVPPATPH